VSGGGGGGGGTGGSQTIPTPGGNVTLTAPNGSQLISFTTAAPQVPPPSGVAFPFGQLSFTATTTPGALVTFTLTLPLQPVGVYKLVANAWQTFPFNGETGAQINGNVVTITIRDNGRGDNNPTAGTITDPLAPAVSAALPPTGSNPEPLIEVALLLLTAGVLLWLGGRRVAGTMPRR
jgi:hypothetical protein